MAAVPSRRPDIDDHRKRSAVAASPKPRAATTDGRPDEGAAAPYSAPTLQLRPARPSTESSRERERASRSIPPTQTRFSIQNTDMRLERSYARSRSLRAGLCLEGLDDRSDRHGPARRSIRAPRSSDRRATVIARADETPWPWPPRCPRDARTNPSGPSTGHSCNHWSKARGRRRPRCTPPSLHKPGP